MAEAGCLKPGPRLSAGTKENSFMGMPIFSYVTNVSTNIAICTILCPLPFSAQGSSAGLPTQTQVADPVIDLASYEIVGGSTGVGTIVTFQSLGLNSTLNAGVLTPVWNALVSPAPVTLANSTNYNNILNGPFHGLRMLISGVVGNGVAYARLSGTIRDK